MEKADNTKALKILSIIKPILVSIKKINQKNIQWGIAGNPNLENVEELLGKGNEEPDDQLKKYYSVLSTLRIKSAEKIKWGKGDIPELEYMDSTLAGLYGYLSDYVYKYH